MKLFGFELGNTRKDIPQQPEDLNKRTFTLPQNEDGAVTVAGAGYYGTYVDLDEHFVTKHNLLQNTVRWLFNQKWKQPLMKL